VFGHPFEEVTAELLGAMRTHSFVEHSRGGGYLTVLEILDLESSKTRNETRMVGTVPDQDKAGQYYGFSREKPARLYAEILRGVVGAVSSWQTRNESEFRYGGAIRAGRFIFSFSGLPEHADEALMLMLAVHFGFLTHTEAIEITKISENPIYEPAAARCLQLAA